MKVNAERIDKNQMLLEVEVPEQEVNKAIDRAFKQVAQHVAIPGFRKGKVPRQIIEKRFGMKAVLDEAFEILAPEAYGKALAEQKLNPVAHPEIEIVQLEQGKPCIFKAKVVTKPEIELGQYKGVEVVRKSDSVDEAAITEHLEQLRQRNAKLVVVENAEAANGDMAIIDFEGSVNGELFEGGTGKSYPLELGSGSFIPGFEDQLLGVKAGEERVVKVTFPETYHAAELAGKDAEFKVTVQDIKKKELPELDDEFVKEASKFETLEELKADVKNKLEETAKQQAEKEFRQNAIVAAVNNCVVEVPQVMVDHRIEHKLEELKMNLQKAGLTLEAYASYLKTDMNGLKEKFREPAEMDVKTDLMLEAIIKAENIAVSQEELDAEIAQVSAAYGVKPEELCRELNKENRMSGLENSVALRKAINFIVDNAIVKND